MNFLKQAKASHYAHEKHIANLMNEKEQRLFFLKHKDCLGYILNVLTLDLLSPLLEKKNTWLTIGDYNGFEAKYLSEHNQSVIASDISDALLKEAKDEGLIAEYQKENVEHLSLNDQSIDFVSCRETFHHFPRAYLGLYEMLRVAKKGVVLIEPIDIISKMPWVLLIKNICDIFDRNLINKIWKNRFSWESVGNYIFKISEREIEKIAMGIGLPCIAFKELNVDLNVKGNIMEVPANYKLLASIKRKAAFKNILCRLRLIPYNTLCAVIFIEMPDADVMTSLKHKGYNILKLPVNPYLKQ